MQINIKVRRSHQSWVAALKSNREITKLFWKPFIVLGNDDRKAGRLELHVARKRDAGRGDEKDFWLKIGSVFW